jgi:formiminotetrahydrofolate cyclodeaminase
VTVADLTIGEFLDCVASREVTPSGGAVAAVGGAAGAALCEMTCVHTLAAADATDDTAALRDARDDLADLRAQLLALADEDVAAVDGVQAAFEAADSVGKDAVQEAAERATESPLETAEACRDVLECAAVATDAGAPSAIPDATTGGSLAHAGLRAAVWTARSNLGLPEDDAFVAGAEERAADLESAGSRLLDSVAANVRETW